MKKILSVTVIVALAFGAFAAVPAQAKKKKPKKIERVEEFEYACPCLGLFQFGSATGGDPNLGGGIMQPGLNEVFVTGEVHDATGLPLNVSLQQDTDGDGFNNPVADFCGSTEKPVTINEGLEIRVFVGGACSDNTPTTGAGGTITFTFSNLP